MKNRFFLLSACCLLFTGIALAQVDRKYLSGAVPEVDGKVVFGESFDLPGLQQAEIYRRALAWANACYAHRDKNMIAYTSEEKFLISCKGNEELIFQDRALSLDKSDMNYQLNLYCENAQCRAEIKAISYKYPAVTGKGFDTYKAETWITDEEAVNKNKLYRTNGKFRIKTIDLVNDIYNSLAYALRSGEASDFHSRVFQQAPPRDVQPVSPVPAAIRADNVSTGTPESALKSHRKIEADKIPGNIIKMLSNDWMLITAGNDAQFNMMTASWGGLGVLWQKPVAICFIHPARHTYELMNDGDYYTLSFYTETYREALQYCGSHSGRDTDKVKGSGLTPVTMPSGAKSFEEAWLILECKKVLALPITAESIHDPDAKKRWSDQAHKIFAGEIIGVWVK
jgi:flavin reductase (DIM6/NTAB) family NADH-FMN oxidoreductase RutF